MTRSKPELGAGVPALDQASSLETQNEDRRAWPSMVDVAALSGVSTATVSRVLAGSEIGVRPATRARVIAAADQLGYQPNRLPRYLRARVVRMIALVVGDIGNPFFTSIARGCEDVLQDHGYSLIVTSTDEDPRREDRRLAEMAAERVGGVVLASTGAATPSLRRMVAGGTAVVAIDRQIPEVDIDSVIVANEAGSYTAVRHLLDLGHRRVGFIGGPALSPYAARLAGYDRALREHGLVRDPLLVRAGDAHESGGYQGARELLMLPVPPSAIFSSSNLTTIGVLRALREQGLTLPEQVSVVGFDDLPVGDLLDPPLTVVVQPAYDIGSQAARLLLRRIGNPTAPVTELVLGTSLQIRGSAGPARP